MSARIVLLFLAAGALASAPPAQFSSTVRGFIKVDAPVVALANVRVIHGDPSKTISDVRKVETVFKQGVGFDPATLIAAVSGKVGLW